MAIELPESTPKNHKSSDVKNNEKEQVEALNPESIKNKTEVSDKASQSSGSYSHDSERLLIGVMLNSQRHGLHLSLMALVSHEDFFVDQHQVTWKIMTAMREAGLTVDPMSIIDHANTKGEFVGGPEYVINTFNDPIARMCSDEAVNAAASRIKGFSMSRKLQRALSMAATLSNTGQEFDQVASYLEDEITNLKRLATSSRTGPREASFFYDAILAKITAKLDGEVVEMGTSTGFPELDNLLGGGLANEDLIVLAGRPGMGKTAFATAMEQNISTSGIATLFFSLEMTGISLAQRNVSRHARIPFNHIRSGDLDEREFEPLFETISVLNKAPCFIDETPGLSMSEIRSRARAFAMLHKKIVLVVDYLQIVQAGKDSKTKDSRVIVSETSQGLKQLARELKCPVIALAQLNRELEKRANKRPMMSDLRESGQLEQDASVIMFLYRDEVYNADSKDAGTTELILAKNRDGKCATVRYSSDLSMMHYSEMGSYQTEEV